MRLGRGAWWILAIGLLAGLDAAHADDFDTGDIFGFTNGSGVGNKGDKQFNTETDFALGRATGVYYAGETTNKFEYTPTDKIQLGFASLLAWHDIKGVSGFADRSQFGFSGFSGEFKYQLLDRSSSSPLAVTFETDPTWRWIGDSDGQRVTNYEVPLMLNGDAEIIKNVLYFGSNLVYEPATTRDPSNQPGWIKESTASISGALSYVLAPSVTVGGEIWYMRHYQSIALANFTGDAVFAGPTLYVKINDKAFISAAWNVQFAGHEVGVPGSLDLADFARQRVKFKINVAF